MSDTERQVSAAAPAAPKEWRGRFFEDFEVGDVYRSRLGGRSPTPTTSGSRA
jgi:hypothetical protein